MGSKAGSQKRRQLLDYKGDKCMGCGKSVQGMLERHGSFNRLFHFHHLDPSKKHPEYDNLINRVVSTDQLDEVDKCVLLCTECHGVAENQKSKGTLTVTVKMGDRETCQTLHGEYLHDFKDNKMTFLTSEPLLAEPYWVRIGWGKRQIRFGTELKDGLVGEFFAQLSEIKQVRVWSKKGELMMELKDRGSGTGQLRYSVRCPFFEGTYSTEKGRRPCVYTRNGLALIRGRDKVERKGIVTAEFTIPSTQEQIAAE